MIYKSTQGGILDVSTESRTVKAVWATFDQADSVGDVILAGAFNKSISERGAGGKNTIFSLVEHQYTVEKALGKPKELYVDGNQLIAVTDLVSTQYASDILTLYQEGLINQHSVGFGLPKNKYEMKNGQRLIKEGILYEGSATLMGVNQNTPTLSVGKSLFDIDKADTAEIIEKMCKVLRSGNISDDMGLLLELQLKHIQSTITQPVTTVEPKTDLKAFGAVIQSLIN